MDEQPQPLDLTTQESNDQEVDVVNIEPTLEQLGEMNCSQVIDWVRDIEGCSEYADNFYNEKQGGWQVHGVDGGKLPPEELLSGWQLRQISR